MRYAFFILATAVFGLATLLPARLFHYFAQSTQTLTALNAKSFLFHFFLFGVAVSIVLFLSSAVTALIHEWLRLRVEADLRERAMCRLHEIPLSHIDASQRGDWLSRVSGDLGRSEMFLTESLPGQVQQGAVILGVGVLFFFQSGWIALLPLAGALVIALLNVLVQTRLSPVLAELRGLHAGIFQMLIESFEGTRTIRSQGTQPFILRRFQGRLQEITSKSMKVVRYLGALIGGTEFVGQILVTLCLSGAAWGLQRGEITLAQALLYPFFIGLFYGGAQRLASSAYDWNRFLIEGGRLAAFLYGEPGTVTVPAAPAISLNGESPERLLLTEVRVGYPGVREMGPMDCEVHRGELLAVVGPSGSGKSTFLEVLAGLRPALGGAIAVEGARKDLWAGEGRWQLPLGLCAYVEQRPYIFEGSLRENLVFGNPARLSDAVLWDFLARTGLESFTEARGGLDQRFSDRGRNLSEGERYRVALCRALLLRRPFLLADEPFASLDTRSVAIVLSTLKAERAQAGIVVVTHFLPEGLSHDAVIDFTNYQVQRRVPSLLSPELSLGVTPASSHNPILERKVQ